MQLNNEERVAIARRVVEKAKGRVPVVIGSTFEGGVEEQAKLMNTMGEMADSVVIITNQIAGMEEVHRIVGGGRPHWWVWCAAKRLSGC